MSERDDIEFDFFEESDTRETPEERPRRGPRPPVRPPTGLTPLLRLIGLISFAILIVLLLVLWVNGCRENKRKDAYRNYVKKVQDYGQQSQRLGRNFNKLLTTLGTKEADVESELSGLARQQEQIASAARGLNPPGRLRADAATDCERRDLGRPVHGTDEERAPAARRHGRERARLDLPPEPRHRHDRVDEVALAAHPWRGDRRLELLAARHGARLDEGAPEREGPVRGQSEHDSAEHRPLVYGHGDELGLPAGGQ